MYDLPFYLLAILHLLTYKYGCKITKVGILLRIDILLLLDTGVPMSINVVTLYVRHARSVMA